MECLGFDLNSSFIGVHSWKRNSGITRFPLAYPHVFFSKNLEKVYYLDHEGCNLAEGLSLKDIFFKRPYPQDLIPYLDILFSLIQETYQKERVEECILALPYQFQTRSLDFFHQWGKVRNIKISFLWRPVAIFLGQSEKLANETVIVIDVLRSAAVITFLTILKESDNIIFHVDKIIRDPALGVDSLLNKIRLSLKDFYAFAGIQCNGTPSVYNWFSLYEELKKTNYMDNWSYFFDSSDMQTPFHKFVLGGIGTLFPGLRKELSAQINDKIFSAKELPGHECAAGCIRKSQITHSITTVFNFDLILKTGERLFNLGKLYREEPVYLKLKSHQSYEMIHLSFLAGYFEVGFEGPVFGSVSHENKNLKKEFLIKVIKKKNYFRVYIDSEEKGSFANLIL
jgi:hypothetical protein